MEEEGGRQEEDAMEGKEIVETKEAEEELDGIEGGNAGEADSVMET